MAEVLIRRMGRIGVGCGLPPATYVCIWGPKLSDMKHHLRIASYNIRKAVGLDWRRDTNRILDVIAEIDADIVVLQEADRRFGRRSGVLPLTEIHQRMGMRLANVALRRESHGWHGNAILCREIYGELQAARIEIPTFEPRGAVSVTLSLPKIGVVGTHLGLTRGVRHKQMQRLATFLENSPYPVVVAGDFNAWSIDSDIFGVEARLITPGSSFHARGPFGAFDRFVLSGELQHVSSHVHKSALAQKASDHLPVVLDIEVPSAET